MPLVKIDDKKGTPPINFKISSKTNNVNNVNNVVKLDHRSHIEKLPDSYIGSIEKTSEDFWVFSENEGKIAKKLTTFIPGKFKIYDELLVNSFDQYVRTNLDKTCYYLDK